MKLSGKMIDVPLTSRFLNRTLPIIAYLPPHDEPGKEYPVLIAQDGREYIQLGRLSSLADDWISKEILQPIIIIAIPYENLQSRRECYHPEGSLHRAYLETLTEEVFPAVASRFPIVSEPDGRTLIGDSLGGTLSLLAALARPDLFGNVIMQSPFVSQNMVDQILAHRESIPLSVYHSIGRHETAVKTTSGKIEDFDYYNQKLHHALCQRGMHSYSFHETDGSHTWRAWQPDLRLALLEKFGY